MRSSSIITHLSILTIRSRDKAGDSTADQKTLPVDAGDASDGEINANGKARGGFSGFAALEAEGGEGGAEEEEDFGGLMVRIYG